MSVYPEPPSTDCMDSRVWGLGLLLGPRGFSIWVFGIVLPKQKQNPKRRQQDYPVEVWRFGSGIAVLGFVLVPRDAKQVAEDQSRGLGPSVVPKPVSQGSQ